MLFLNLLSHLSYLPLGNQSIKGLIHNSNNRCFKYLLFPILGFRPRIFLNNFKQLKTLRLITYVNLGHSNFSTNLSFHLMFCLKLS